MIRIKNIYYMLSYAFKELQQNSYSSVETEEFDNIEELLTEILRIGINRQIKRGLYRDYVDVTDDLNSPKGKINVTDSIRRQTFLKGGLSCYYDEFSMNCIENQIIKSTLLIIMRCSSISKPRKKDIKKLIPYFGTVDDLDLTHLDWKIAYNKVNQSYEMIIEICHMLVKGLLQTEQAGDTKLNSFFENNLPRLYEKFILEYYRREWPEINANADQVPWNTDDGIITFLPVMQTDITLRYRDRVHIIDAKYYTLSMQSRFDTSTLKSNHLYQIFTYVKNETEASKNHRVSGMLLYAKTDELVVPDNDYRMSGNRIAVKTLDLDVDFSEVRNQLDNIVNEYLLN